MVCCLNVVFVAVVDVAFVVCCCWCFVTSIVFFCLCRVVVLVVRCRCVDGCLIGVVCCCRCVLFV